MLVSVMRVRPVGMRMSFFTVVVLVNMRLIYDSGVFVNMMEIVVIVKVSMSRLVMHVGVHMIFRAYEPDAGDRESMAGNMTHPIHS